MLGKLPVPGRPANLDHGRARASALAVCKGGWFGYLIHHHRLCLRSLVGNQFTKG